MTTQDAIKFFGSRENLQAVLNIRSRQAIWTWGAYPPARRQYQIEVLTNGVLRAERPLMQKAAERPATPGSARRPVVETPAQWPASHPFIERRAATDIRVPANHEPYAGIERRLSLVRNNNCERPVA